MEFGAAWFALVSYDVFLADPAYHGDPNAVAPVYDSWFETRQCDALDIVHATNTDVGKLDQVGVWLQRTPVIVECL